MGDRANPATQYGTAVTTGQSQYDWQARGGRRETFKCKLQPNAIPPLAIASSFSLKDASHPVLSGDCELKHCTATDTTRKSSDSMESMQQHIATTEPVISDPESLSITDSEESEDEDRAELITSRSARLVVGSARNKNEKVSKEKKKVGRPIAYRGDPDAPELTEQERRRIKRRIANRESARRVRHKRQELLDDLQVKIDLLQAHNADLRMDAAESKFEKDELSKQLRELSAKYKQMMSTNASMQVELEALRSSLQLRMTALENALDRQENGSDSQEEKTLFGTAQAQSSVAPGYNSQPTYPFNEHGDFKGSYSFQLALDNFPSFPLGERSVELLPNEGQDLAILKAPNCSQHESEPT